MAEAKKITESKEDNRKVTIERVQTGVRMEKRLLKVLKGIAEFYDTGLGELLEEIVLHTFIPVEGKEGKACASPFGKESYEVIEGLKKVYGLNYEAHDSYRFTEK